MNLSQIAAVAFLVLLVAAPVAVLAYAMARSRFSPVQCLLWAVAYLLCKFLWRTRWPGRLPVAADQGAVIVCNHRSSVDPFFVQTVTTRKIHWMAAREYCERPAFRWFMNTCEVIPVGRGGIDTAATKAAIRIVSQGGLVGMLPEGRINVSDELLLPARPGAALVALKTSAAIVPCYIAGAPYRRHTWSPLLMPARVELRIGPPVDLSDLHGREQEPGVVEEAMRRTLQAMAGLAGRPDFEPQIAGRHWMPTDEELEAATAAAAAAERRQVEQ